MRLGINASALLARPALEPLAEHARRAGEDGFSSWWLAQTGLVDALTVFTAAAPHAPEIEFGTAVVPTFPRHPQALAAQALTTQAAVGGRLTLGIGLAHQPSVEGRWRLSWERPVRHLMDYLDVLLPLLETGRADHHGEIWGFEGEYPRPVNQAPRVMVAALGEQVLRITGRRTDGTILWCVGPKTIRDHIAPIITEAAESAGRPAPRIVCSLPVWVTDEPEKAHAEVADALTVYGELPSYRAMLDREGVDGPADIALIGDEYEVADMLTEIASAGATDFTAVEQAGDPEEAARTRALLKSWSPKA